VPPSKVSKLRTAPDATDDDIRDWTRPPAARTRRCAARLLHTLDSSMASGSASCGPASGPPAGTFEWISGPGCSGLRGDRRARAAADRGVREGAVSPRHRREAAQRHQRRVAARSGARRSSYRPTSGSTSCSPRRAAVHALPAAVMLGQLDRLVSLSPAANVRLGVIGSRPVHHLAVARFWLYDSDRVLIRDLRHPGPAQPRRSSCTRAPSSSWRRWRATGVRRGRS